MTCGPPGFPYYLLELILRIISIITPALRVYTPQWAYRTVATDCRAGHSRSELLLDLSGKGVYYSYTPPPCFGTLLPDRVLQAAQALL